MSPEQTLGQKVGPPADCFALGIIMCEMLTGRYPESPGATPRRKSPQNGTHSCSGAFRPPRVRRLQKFVPELSREICAVILRALARRPSDRYEHGRAMARALKKATRYRPGGHPRRIVCCEYQRGAQRVGGPSGQSGPAHALAATTPTKARPRQAGEIRAHNCSKACHGWERDAGLLRQTPRPTAARQRAARVPVAQRREANPETVGIRARQPSESTSLRASLGRYRIKKGARPRRAGRGPSGVRSRSGSRRCAQSPARRCPA